MHNSKLLKIALEEHHLLLLGAIVGSAEYVVILLAGLIERNFQFNNL